MGGGRKKFDQPDLEGIGFEEHQKSTTTERRANKHNVVHLNLQGGSGKGLMEGVPEE